MTGPALVWRCHCDLEQSACKDIKGISILVQVQRWSIAPGQRGARSQGQENQDLAGFQDVLQFD